MTALGRAGEMVRRAGLRLLDLVDDVSRWPVSTPFYSTLALPGEAMAVPGLLHVRQRWYALSLYDDTFATIGTAAALALADIRETGSEEETPLAVAHPRYRCAGIADYVRRFALPPYIGDSSVS